MRVTLLWTPEAAVEVEVDVELPSLDQTKTMSCVGDAHPAFQRWRNCSTMHAGEGSNVPVTINLWRLHCSMAAYSHSHSARSRAQAAQSATAGSSQVERG